jgi:hypothetical protein
MGSKSYSKGISWFDDCRIPFVDESDMMKPTIATRDEFNDYKKTEGRENIRQGGGFIKQSNTQGRFPANLLVCDDMLNDGIITKQSQRTYKPTDNSASLFGNSPQAHGTGIGDSGSSSRYYNIDKWFDNIISE